jgi:hypothetical protein
VNEWIKAFHIIAVIGCMTVRINDLRPVGSRQIHRPVTGGCSGNRTFPDRARHHDGGIVMTTATPAVCHRTGAQVRKGISVTV